jgi:hypothetical protein
MLEEDIFESQGHRSDVSLQEGHRTRETTQLEIPKVKRWITCPVGMPVLSGGGKASRRSRSGSNGRTERNRGIRNGILTNDLEDRLTKPH